MGDRPGVDVLLVLVQGLVHFSEAVYGHEEGLTVGEVE